MFFSFYVWFYSIFTTHCCTFTAGYTVFCIYLGLLRGSVNGVHGALFGAQTAIDTLGVDSYLSGTRYFGYESEQHTYWAYHPAERTVNQNGRYQQQKQQRKTDCICEDHIEQSLER